MNIDEGLFAFHHFLNIGLELVDLDALFTDDDARTSGMDIYLGLVGHPLDFDPRNSGMIEPLLDKSRSFRSSCSNAA